MVWEASLAEHGGPLLGAQAHLQEVVNEALHVVRLVYDGELPLLKVRVATHGTEQVGRVGEGQGSVLSGEALLIIGAGVPTVLLALGVLTGPVRACPAGRALGGPRADPTVKIGPTPHLLQSVAVVRLILLREAQRRGEQVGRLELRLNRHGDGGLPNARGGLDNDVVKVVVLKRPIGDAECLRLELAKRRHGEVGPHLLPKVGQVALAWNVDADHTHGPCRCPHLFQSCKRTTPNG